jgi:hypothetical protein
MSCSGECATAKHIRRAVSGQRSILITLYIFAWSGANRGRPNDVGHQIFPCELVRTRSGICGHVCPAAADPKWIHTRARAVAPPFWSAATRCHAMGRCLAAHTKPDSQPARHEHGNFIGAEVQVWECRIRHQSGNRCESCLGTWKKEP